QAMAEVLTRGHWQRAIEIRSPANAATDPAAHLTSVSCGAAGDCVAVGGYITKGNDEEVMAAVEARGKWRRAVQVRLPRNANAEPQALLNDVSCVPGSYCEAVGTYVEKSGVSAAFAVHESGGSWRPAVQVGSLPAGAHKPPGASDLAGVSCTRSDCLAAGFYQDVYGGLVPMVVLGDGAEWQRARAVPVPAHAAARSQQDAGLLAISCDAADLYCTAVGDYANAADISEAMAAAGGM
ncbi:MAG TPA: hypothetical protein VEL03_21990, partial [Streptosporangiaceae bacterium]|nr:hypothetical protein [Streptosporangiaceae bacterium]